LHFSNIFHRAAREIQVNIIKMSTHFNVHFIGKIHFLLNCCNGGILE
jgi:hypothetical protein